MSSIFCSFALYAKLAFALFKWKVVKVYISQTSWITSNEYDYFNWLTYAIAVSNSTKFKCKIIYYEWYFYFRIIELYGTMINMNLFIAKLYSGLALSHYVMVQIENTFIDRFSYFYSITNTYF